MFSCVITSCANISDSKLYGVVNDKVHANEYEGIIWRDSMIGRLLYDHVQNDLSEFVWKEARYGISDVRYHRKITELLKYLQPESQEICKVLSENKIKYLVHFTRIENLRSILTHGILDVQSLIANGIEYIGNDKRRYDGKTDCTCFSIEFPNDSLLNSFRRKAASNKWGVLVLDVKILVESDAKSYFCMHNAATGSIRNEINQLDTVESFRKMFSEIITYTRSGREQIRLRTNHKSYLPTSNQAEILITGKIDTSYINAIAVSSIEDKLRVDELLSDCLLQRSITCFVEPRYFHDRDIVTFKDRA